jgi:hypothetical protein
MNWLDKLMDLLNLDVLRLPELPTILKRKVREPEDVAPTETAAEGEKPKEPIKPPLEGEAKEEPRKESPIEQIPKKTHELPDSSDLLSQGWDSQPSKPPKPTEGATTYSSPLLKEEETKAELPAPEVLGVKPEVISPEPVKPPEVVGIPPEAYAGRVAVTVRQPDGQVKTYYVWGAEIEKHIRAFRAEGCEILSIARVG